MAEYDIPTGLIAVHGKKLVANTADAVVFADDCDRVEVLTDGAADLYFTTDGTTATVGGAHCYRLPAGSTSAVSVRSLRQAGSMVSLVSAGTPTYSVTRAE